MVIVFADQLAVTPVGSPVAEAVSIPVAPVVVWVILVIALLTHTVGLDEAAPALLLFTVIVTAAEVLSYEEHPVTYATRL